MQTGSSQAVFDTGLKGECRLGCTPDYIIVSEHIPTESELAEEPELEATSKGADPVHIQLGL